MTTNTFNRCLKFVILSITFFLFTKVSNSQSPLVCPIKRVEFIDEKDYIQSNFDKLSEFDFKFQINYYYLVDVPDTLLIVYENNNKETVTTKVPLPLKPKYKLPMHLFLYLDACVDSTFKLEITSCKNKFINKPINPVAFAFQRRMNQLEKKYKNSTTVINEITPELTDKQPKSPIEDRKESPQNIIIIDKEDFENFGYFSAGEILRTLPGVFIEDPSENNSISYRGAPSEYTQILIDGERLPDGQDNRTFEIDRIPASMIERIEIYRGATAIHDAQGIAVTINIILKKSGNSPRHELSSSYGYNATKGNVYQFAGVSDLRKNNWTFQPKATYQNRGNGKDKYKSEMSDIKNDKYENDLREIFYEEFAFLPTIVFSPKPNRRLTLSPLFLFSEGDGLRSKTGLQHVFIPGNTSDSVLMNNREQQLTYKKRNTTSLRGSYRWKVDKYLELNAFLSLNNSFNEIDIRKTKIFDEDIYNTNDRRFDKVQDRDAFTRLGVVYTPLTFFQMTGGVESNIKNRHIDRKDETNGWIDRTTIEELYVFREFRNNVYVNNSFSFKKLRFDLGLRGEYLRSENTIHTNYFTNFMLIEKPITKEGSSFNLDPYFNFSFKLNPQSFVNIIAKGLKPFVKTPIDSLKKNLNHKLGEVRVKPNITRTVKRPNFTSLNPYVEYREGTWLNPDKGGNPDLQPETSWNMDLALEYYPKNKKGLIGFNIYRRFITKMVAKGIDIDPWSGRYTERPLNIGDGTMSGMELDFAYKITQIKNILISTRGNLTVPHSAIKDPKTGESRKFKNQPDFFYNAGFDVSSLKKRKLSLGANYNHYPGFARDNFKTDGSYQRVEQFPLFRIDTYFSVSLIKNLFLRVTAQNFILSQKHKKDLKYFPDGSVETFKTDREIFRPVYNVVLNYKF
jgi:outer membrane receptor protein involved in Fe transport